MQHGELCHTYQTVSKIVSLKKKNIFKTVVFKKWNRFLLSKLLFAKLCIFYNYLFVVVDEANGRGRVKTKPTWLLWRSFLILQKYKHISCPWRPCAGLESVCRSSGGLGPAREARVGSLLSQPAGHRCTATRPGCYRLPVPPAQPERLQFLCYSTGTHWFHDFWFMKDGPSLNWNHFFFYM